MSEDAIDVVIVGGGPAGLSAGLWLGRYRRSVRIFDAGDPRNEPAWAVHGYPGLQDPSPTELRRRLFEQAQGAGADIVQGEITHISGRRNEFVLTAADGATVRARRVLLAYGLRDYIPEINGLRELYGTSVFHCPDCDGPAVAGRRIGVYGWNRPAANLALYLRHFSDHVTLLTGGEPLDLSERARAALDRGGIPLVDSTILRVVGHGGNLTQAEIADGDPVLLDALFFHLGSEPRCDLAPDLGCEVDEEGYISVDRGQETSVPGIHAAGDLTGHPHLASVAAAEGVRAALAIHRSLLPDWRYLPADA